MNSEEKVKTIGMKLYVQLILLDNKIINKVKIKYDERKINFLQIYYKKFYYSFSDYYVYITKISNPSKFEINFCNKDLNPCKLKNDVKKYTITIFFKFMNNRKKKMYIPLKIFEFNCSMNNIKPLEKFTNDIKNKLKKDKFLNNIIQEIIIEN